MIYGLALTPPGETGRRGAGETIPPSLPLGEGPLVRAVFGVTGGLGNGETPG